MTRKRMSIRSERGAALIEAAFTIPLLLLVSLLIVEFGRAFETWQVMTNAAREGARVAVLPNATAAAVEARVRSYLDAGVLIDVSSASVAVAGSPVSLGGTVTAPGSRVTVTYPFQFMVLGPIARLAVRGSTLGAPLTLTTQAVMRNE